MKKIISSGVIVLLIILSMNSGAQTTITNFTTTEGLNDNFVNCVAVDANNVKWFGTASGVARFDGAWTVYNVANTDTAIPDNFILCIGIDKLNNVWVGTDGYGVSKFNGTGWTKYTISDGLVNNSVHSIAGDSDSSIWFGTYGYGLSHLKNNTWTNFTYVDGLPGSSILGTASIKCIAVDNSGNKWFGTDMGISKFNGVTFTTIDQLSCGDSLLSNFITSVAVDNDNNKWIAAYPFGLTKLNSADTWVQNYRMSNGLYNDYICDIVIDTANAIWLGMYADYNQEGGVTRFSGNTFTSFDMITGMVDKQIVKLAVDKENNIWAATGGGVSKIHFATGIEKFNLMEIFQTYPNPVNDYLSVDLTAISDKNVKSIEVIDMLGKIVQEFQIDQNTNIIKIPVCNYQNGIYNVKIGNYLNKIIVNKN